MSVTWKVYTTCAMALALFATVFSLLWAANYHPPTVQMPKPVTVSNSQIANIAQDKICADISQLGILAATAGADAGSIQIVESILECPGGSNG